MFRSAVWVVTCKQGASNSNLFDARPIAIATNQNIEGCATAHAPHLHTLPRPRAIMAAVSLQEGAPALLISLRIYSFRFYADMHYSE